MPSSEFLWIDTVGPYEIFKLWLIIVYYDITNYKNVYIGSDCIENADTNYYKF